MTSATNKFVVVFLIFFLIVYFCFIIETPSAINEYATADRANIPKGLVDAIVFISMGQMSKQLLVDYSVTSIRKLGRWTGDIYVLTDAPSCFDELVSQHDVKTLYIPSVRDIIKIKLMKTTLMDMLPREVGSALYIDADIIVTRSLDIFLKDLEKVLIQNSKSKAASSSGSIIRSSRSDSSDYMNVNSFDFAAFPDAKGHYVGFCSGCEKWHTGVLWIRRGAGMECMKKWGDILQSGKFNTDQQSLDTAEAEGSCSDAIMLPAKHLLFAKDYIGMTLTSGQTFIHATSVLSTANDDSFYNRFVLPLIRNSLSPTLDPDMLNRPVKQCSIRATTVPSAAPTSAMGYSKEKKRKSSIW